MDKSLENGDGLMEKLAQSKDLSAEPVEFSDARMKIFKAKKALSQSLKARVKWAILRETRTVDFSTG